MIDVANTVRVYELNGNEPAWKDGKMLRVLSHWNMNSWVTLEVGDQRLTVNASDLHAAIVNATNSGKR